VRLVIADPSLVLLVGPSGSGKSTFAARCFPPGGILSSDELRRALADDPNDQAASADAFRVLDLLVAGRLKRRLLTVVDATNLRAETRQRWLRTARRYGVPAVAIVFDLPLETYLAMNRRRPGRSVGEWVVREQYDRLQLAMAALSEEGYAEIYFLRDPADVQATAVEFIRGPTA
jgi:protein phosphatase